MTTTISDSAARTPATAVLTPLPDVSRACPVWVAAAFLLRAVARGTLADPDAVGRVLRHHRPGARRPGALTHGEIRVLHYLPTNLSAREIASELCLSVNTRARALGLLAPSPRGR